MDIELAEPIDRLRLPLIETGNKGRLEELNRTPAESFLIDETVQQPGSKVLFGELRERLDSWAALNFPKSKITDEELKAALPQGVYTRRGTANKLYVENLSLVTLPPPAPDNQPQDSSYAQAC